MGQGGRGERWVLGGGAVDVLSCTRESTAACLSSCTRESGAAYRILVYTQSRTPSK